jgi:hypothetical protein
MATPKATEPTIGFSPNSVSVTRGTQSVAVHLVLSEALTSDLTVTLHESKDKGAPTGSNAVAGAEYVRTVKSPKNADELVPYQATFTAGATSASAVIMLRTDSLPHAESSFAVGFTIPTGSHVKKDKANELCIISIGASSSTP